MASTFHHFAQLPQELQDIIWEFAMRQTGTSGQGQAHWFALYHSSRDNVNPSDFRDLATSEPFSYGQRLALPTYQSESELPSNIDEFSWCQQLELPTCRMSDLKHLDKMEELRKYGISNSNGKDILDTAIFSITPQIRHNPSAYLIDAGMWTACKDSRLIMQKHLKRQTWDYVRNQAKHKTKTTATAYFTGGSTADDLHIYIVPHQDLIVLQPQNLKTLDLASLAPLIPFSSIQGYSGLKNIGIEFQPKWGRHVATDRLWSVTSTTSIDMLFDKVPVDALDVTMVWIIDYNLSISKRTSQDQDKFCMQPGRRFFANGLELVEVKCDYPVAEYYQSAPDSVRFMAMLQETIDDNETKCLDGMAHYVPYLPMRCDFGVLACEEI